MIPPTPEESPDKPITIPQIPIPDRIDIADLSLEFRSPEGTLRIDGLTLLLDETLPGVFAFEQVLMADGTRIGPRSAETDGTPGRLEFSGLDLNAQLTIKRLTLDHSRLSEKKLGLESEWRVGSSGAASVAARLTGSKEGLQFEGDAQLTGLEATMDGPPPALRLVLNTLNLDATGILEDPGTWAMRATLAGAASDGFLPDPATISAELRLDERTIRLTKLDATSGGTRLNGEGQAAWNGEFAKVENWKANLRLALEVEDLQRWEKALHLPAAGKGTAELLLFLEDGELQGKHRINTEDFRLQDYAAKTFGLGLTAKGPLQAAIDGEFRSFKAELNAAATAFVTQGVLSDSVLLKATTDDGSVHIEIPVLRAVRGRSVLDIAGSMDLPYDQEPFQFDAKWEFDGPDLAPLLENDSLAGKLKGNGEVAFDGKIWTGRAALEGAALAYEKFVARSLELNAEWSGDGVKIPAFNLVIDDRNSVSLSGDITLGESPRFSAGGRVQMPDLPVLEPLLRAAGRTERLGGGLTATVDLEGNPFQVSTYKGSLTLNAANVVFGDIRDARLEASISISDGSAVINRLQAAALDYRTELSGRWDWGGFQLASATLHRGDLLLATAGAWFPLANSASGYGLDPVRPLEITAVAERLDLERLLQAFQIQSQARGILNANMRLSGLPDSLDGDVRATATGIIPMTGWKLRESALELDLRLRNGVATLDSTLRQPELQPITMTGRMPVDVRRLMAGQGLAGNTPLDARITMAPSTLDFITPLSPQIRNAQGRLGFEVRVGGTVAAPLLSGNSNVDIEALRMRDPNIPPVRDLTGHLEFEGDRLTIRQMNGDVAGGAVSMTGFLRFPARSVPEFEMNLKAKEVLLFRNDMATQRANADLTVTGALNAATVRGTIGLTKGRFFREIEILPLTLPGRPAPNQYVWDENLVLSFPAIRDWKFDVRIRTDDAFLIRSNLARGDIDADVELTGTGLRPELTGTVRAEGLETSLPFSRMVFSNTLLTFTPGQPLQPMIVAFGTARIRDYEVRATITGRLPAPSVVFSSDPPLPQEDIVSLIATGTTLDDLRSGGEVLAGRAALLLFQRVARMIFPARRVRNEDVGEFLDRLSLQVGGLDPRTGKQGATMRFRATNNIFLIGDLDVEGEFRGQIKYVIRLR